MSIQRPEDLARRGLPPDNDMPPLADDLIRGIKGIAKALNRTERQTFHLVETKQIPVGKLGGRHVASLAVLRRHLAAITGGGD